MENGLWEEGAAGIAGGAVTKLLQLYGRKVAGPWLRAVTVEVDRGPGVLAALVTVATYTIKVTQKRKNSFLAPDF